jgi:hypothetical protein
MKKAMSALFGFLLAAVFLMSGNVFAEENANTSQLSVASLEAMDASVTSSSEDQVPLDEEIRDEEVIDTDA